MCVVLIRRFMHLTYSGFSSQIDFAALSPRQRPVTLTQAYRYWLTLLVEICWDRIYGYFKESDPNRLQLSKRGRESAVLLHAVYKRSFHYNSLSLFILSLANLLIFYMSNEAFYIIEL